MIFRDPPEETQEYPGLVVHDGRVSGSITCGVTRHPIWCHVGYDWQEVENGWPTISDPPYNWTKDKEIEFLHHLTQMRGEFARLLLVLANAERLEHEREDHQWQDHINDAHAAEVASGDPIMCACQDLQDVAAWWEDPDAAETVRDQLQRCLDALPLVEELPTQE